MLVVRLAEGACRRFIFFWTSSPDENAMRPLSLLPFSALVCTLPAGAPPAPARDPRVERQ